MLRSKIVGVAGTCALALGLSACGGGGGGAGEEEAGGDETLTIGFVPGIASDPFFAAMQLGAEKKAKELGVELLWQGAPDEYSPESQLPFVETMLTQGVDGLILVPTDPDALQPSVARAAAQDIPVITVDTTVTDSADLLSFITGDSADGGQQAAQTLADQIGDEGEVFIMSSSPTATTNRLRVDGFTKEIEANHPDITIVGTEFANSQPAAATSAVSSVLLNSPDLKGIFAVDGTTGTGSVAALRNAGALGTVKLVGYDAYADQVAELEDGSYSALIAQSPGKEAEMALQFMFDKLRDEDTSKIEKEVVIPNVVLTAENLEDNRQYVYPAK